MRLLTLILVAYCSSYSNCRENCSDANEEWNHFKIKYQKTYRNVQEEHHRMSIFYENLKLICEHNVRFKNHLETYEKGVNLFADMNFDEFRSTHLGFNPKMMKLTNFYNVPWDASNRRSDIPNQVNRIEKGACGACYAFSAIGSVEAQLFKKHNVLIELSAQEIVDCTIIYGNEGCISGIMSQSFDYITENGITSESDYPYSGKNETCSANKLKKVSKIRGYVQLPPTDENFLMKAVANVGPISAAMEVTNNTRQFVGKSVFYDQACHRSSDYMNHAVLIVGYGSYEGLDYWLIKNSWGESFGDKGFAKIARNKGNHCNIATDVSFPVL